MPYASNGRISYDPFPDAIEISQAQYDEALAGVLEGKVVSIEGGFSVAYPPEPEPDPEPEITVDELWDALRAERDGLIAATDWLVQRHAEELVLELDTTLTPEQHTDLLAYRQALRDLPETTTDPTNPEWPNEPTA